MGGELCRAVRDKSGKERGGLGAAVLANWLC